MGGHHHHHHHGHDHYAHFSRAFAIGIFLNTVYIAIEGGIGWSIGSLALLADAGHNLSDVLGLLLAWLAHWLTRFPASGRRTYGWRSSTILAAFLNSLLLLMAIGGLLWEAMQRLGTPQSVPGKTIMIVAGIGVVLNTLTALLFLRGSHDDLNVRGAFLHMAADAAVSLGVVAGGGLALAYGWTWIDPVMTIGIVAVIFYGTWGLLFESANLLLHAAPEGVDIDAVREFLVTRVEVDSVHDLHVWAMSTTQTCLTAHLVTPHLTDTDPFLHATAHELQEKFGIDHVTLQLEATTDTSKCALADPTTI